MSDPLKTVLVVDDDEDIVELLTLFIGAEQFRCVGTTDGHEGLKLMREMHATTLLCDLSMSGLSGTDMIHQLRVDPMTATVKIILMSGHACPNFRALGADGFLQKPFRPFEVIQALTAVRA